MERIQIKTQPRTIGSRGQLIKLRKSGLIPAVLYGHSAGNVPLQLDLIEFEKAYRKAGESTIVDLVVEGGKTHGVLIQDVQMHPTTTRVIHADFYEVSMTEKLKATVALEFVGEAKAVKELGGTLVKTLNEVEVECLPADLPHNIEVDISSLRSFEDTILVQNLKISPKVEILTEPEEMIAKVQPPRDVEAELAGPVEENVEAVEGAAETKPEGETEAEEKK